MTVNTLRQMTGLFARYGFLSQLRSRTASQNRELSGIRIELLMLGLDVQ